MCTTAMASGGEVGKEAIVSAIQELRDTQYRLLSDARNDVQGGWSFTFIIINYNKFFFFKRAGFA